MLQVPIQIRIPLTVAFRVSGVVENILLISLSFNKTLFNYSLFRHLDNMRAKMCHTKEVLKDMRIADLLIQLLIGKTLKQP